MARVMVVGGARGVGAAIGERFARRGDEVLVTSRTGGRPDWAAAAYRLDVTDEGSIRDVFRGRSDLDVVVVAAGLLHDGDLQPEKRLEHVEPAHVARLFAVNATGPLLVAKHALPTMQHGRPAVFASLSARVGSIGDNRLGGWYAYRASKAAQNMFTKTLAIEWARRAPALAVIGLHPGTVATDLSAPFRSRVPADRLFTPSFAAERLVALLDGIGPQDSGKVFAWDGREIVP